MRLSKKRKQFQNLAKMGFYCYIHLEEYEKAIGYFKENYTENNKEIQLYVLLDRLFVLGLKDYWIREYCAAKDEGIKPRESLEEVYRFIQKNKKFPKHMY